MKSTATGTVETPEMAATVQATEDFQEGIASFIDRRPARFRGG
jgi:hypothetical protein